jgi:spore cortex formation protein SpoVR/YcgB (stage V sporulation)
MKIYALSLIAGFLLVQDNVRLNGTYKIEFDKKYAQQGYQITFSDSVYKKIMPDAVTSKGKIMYAKYKTILRKDKEENPIEIDNRDLGKDTIKFATRNKTDLSLVINRGNLIRIKK